MKTLPLAERKAEAKHQKREDPNWRLPIYKEKGEKGIKEALDKPT